MLLIFEWTTGFLFTPLLKSYKFFSLFSDFLFHRVYIPSSFVFFFERDWCRRPYRESRRVLCSRTHDPISRDERSFFFVPFTLLFRIGCHHREAFLCTTDSSGFIRLC